LNLERALKLGDELGGHIVSGHVDGVAEVIAMADEGDSTRVTLPLGRHRQAHTITRNRRTQRNSIRVIGRANARRQIPALRKRFHHTDIGNNSCEHGPFLFDPDTGVARLSPKGKPCHDPVNSCNTP
jgi:hypothetical protein